MFKPQSSQLSHTYGIRLDQLSEVASSLTTRSLDLFSVNYPGQDKDVTEWEAADHRRKKPDGTYYPSVFTVLASEQIQQRQKTDPSIGHTHQNPSESSGAPLSQTSLLLNAIDLRKHLPRGILQHWIRRTAPHNIIWYNDRYRIRR